MFSNGCDSKCYTITPHREKIKLFEKKSLIFLRCGGIIKKLEEPEEFLAGINVPEEPETARLNPISF
jgi:hypothetical protein